MNERKKERMERMERNKEKIKGTINQTNKKEQEKRKGLKNQRKN